MVFIASEKKNGVRRLSLRLSFHNFYPRVNRILFTAGEILLICQKMEIQKQQRIDRE
jgi:hypothetical protein